MKKEIRWGIMGAGRMANWFTQGLNVAEGACKYAIGSRDIEKGKKFAEEFGYEKAYGSYEEFLQDENIDVVYIATPVRYHYEHIKMCLEAGKNVLCEKSLTVNAAQAKEVAALAREKGLFLMEAMWTKCQPVFREMMNWIKNGVIGDVKAVDINFYTACGKGHRLYKHELAGGAFLDLGFYPVAMACSFLGKHPEKIINHTIMGAGNVDYLDSMVLEYDNGRFAHLSCGLGAEKMVTLYVLGTKGRIAIQDEFFFQAQKAKAMNFDNEILAEVEGPFIANGYEYEAIEVMECLRNGKTESDAVPLDETIAIMEILDACREQAGFRFDFE